MDEYDINDIYTLLINSNLLFFFINIASLKN